MSLKYKIIFTAPMIALLYFWWGVFVLIIWSLFAGTVLVNPKRFYKVEKLQEEIDKLVSDCTKKDLTLGEICQI